MRAVRITNRRGSVGVSLAGVALLVAACSGRTLDRELVVDTSDSDVGHPPSNAAPGRAPAGSPTNSDRDPSSPSEALPEPTNCDPGACTLPSADGFSVVLFGDATTECPSGFRTADVLEDPTPTPGACTCGSCSTRVDCTAGSVPTFYDDEEGSCRERGLTLRANGGACDDRRGRLGVHASVAPPRAIVGACSAEGVAVRSAVSTTPRRTCMRRRSTCPDRACDAPAGMQACLVKEGDVECPATAPAKHLVGSDFTLACATCGCNVDAVCEGKMRFYERKHCEGAPTRTLPVGQCTETEGEDFESTRWVGTVGPARCRKDAPPPAAVGLDGATTVCCAS